MRVLRRFCSKTDILGSLASQERQQQFPENQPWHGMPLLNIQAFVDTLSCFPIYGDMPLDSELLLEDID